MTTVDRQGADRARPAKPAADPGYFRVGDWSGGYFRVSEKGTIQALAGRAAGGAAVDLHDLVEGLAERGINTPVLLRFADILDDRLRALAEAFGHAIRENGYAGRYRPIYPIKVNQSRQIVEEVRRFGSKFGCGVEVGSKPELLAVMAMTGDNPDQIILCNGFKDAAYIEAVVLASKLGRSIIPIVEKLSELRHIVQFAKKYGVRPAIGVRVKLASRGRGRWETSAGIKSKFGLFVSEAVEMIEILRKEDMLDCLQLLHCHAGSQIEEIQRVKEIVTELTHVYVGLVRMGAGMKYLDVGGGLGVDYRGMQASSTGSINYTLEEYASDVVYRIGAVCSAEGVAHPTILTECGRAMTAYSSVLVFDVLGAGGPKTLGTNGSITLPDTPDLPQPVLDLYEAYKSVDEAKYAECYHDAVQARDAAMALFGLGYMDLQHRSLVEKLFWSTCVKVQKVVSATPPDEVPDDLWELENLLSGIYFCNFSLFQSLPDSWAIDQLFPIAPIHRLNEEPTERVVLADITCDSDGQIQGYIGADEPEKTILLHPLREGEAYYLGVFLVGAYQETLGDLHNLFGDAHAVHVRVEDGHWAIEEIVKGDTASEVLTYMQHNPADLAASLSKDCERAVRAGRLTVAEARVLQTFYERGLSSYTYLEPELHGGAS